MDFFSDRMPPLQEQSLPSVNTHLVAKVDDVPIDLTALFCLVDMEILAADDTGFLKLGGDHSGMGGLAAARGEQTLGLGYFLDVFRNRVLADKDEGRLWVLFA